MTSKSAVTDETEIADQEKVPSPAEEKRSAKLGAAVRRGARIGDSAIKLKTVVSSALILVVIAGLGVLGWQVHAKADELDHLHGRAADATHAENAALDYATGAAEMDFHDLASWRTRLTKGTTPELSNRLTQAATSMEQIIAPLQWTSSAKPIAAKVRSDANGTYSVDCFVSVTTKNSQAPDGINSTATYRITIDGNRNWIITDIAGIDSALSAK
ncbi:hypothetical protein ACIHDR_23835 [Nocardia sp. NPDC052278]|uniref:hypothetical protein n=1 Tax=unclassified Nocardia TaxID=2637762 RepID=UPI00369A2141